ncbi:MAG: hypothetical protein AAF518_05600 [Spirochaetota bacterium]
MDSKQRAQLIREANEAFNSEDYDKARKLYLQTNYREGLIRMGNYYMYDRRLPMLAYNYYKQAGLQEKVDEIFQRMLMALSEWIGKDKFKIQQPVAQESTPVSPSDFQVHPILREKALEILQKNGEK